MLVRFCALVNGQSAVQIWPRS